MATLTKMVTVIGNLSCAKMPIPKRFFNFASSTRFACAVSTNPNQPCTTCLFGWSVQRRRRPHSDEIRTARGLARIRRKHQGQRLLDQHLPDAHDAFSLDSGAHLA